MSVSSSLRVNMIRQTVMRVLDTEVYRKLKLLIPFCWCSEKMKNFILNYLEVATLPLEGIYILTCIFRTCFMNGWGLKKGIGGA